MKIIPIQIALLLILALLASACGSVASPVPNEQPNSGPGTAQPSAPSPTPRSTTPPAGTTVPSGEETPTPEADVSFIVDSNANMRRGPGIDYPIAGGVKTGDILPVYGKSRYTEWYLIDLDNYFWVSAEVGHLSDPTASIRVMPASRPVDLPTALPTPSPTIEPALSLTSIYNSYASLGWVQYKDYKASIAGQLVRENVKIRQVFSKEAWLLNGVWSPTTTDWGKFCVVVTQTPPEVTATLSDGSEIFLQAMISGFLSGKNHYTDCESTLILVYENSQ